MAVRVVISEAAIFRTTRDPNGSAGTAQWMDDLAERTIGIARSIAPVGDVKDAGSRSGLVGIYISSFSWDRRGGNLKYIRRRVLNSAPHAGIVERGRPYVAGKQKFTSRKYGGRWVVRRFTRYRPGEHILEKAQDAAWRSQQLGIPVERLLRRARLGRL